MTEQNASKQTSAFLRALANKPKPRPRAIANDEDFFSRSSHTYAILAAEDEARRKKKALEASQEHSNGEIAQRESKRRRVSRPEENDDKTDGHSSDSIRVHDPSKVDEVLSDSGGLPTLNPSLSHKSLSKQYEKSFATTSPKLDMGKSATETTVVSLSDSDEGQQGQKAVQNSINDNELKAVKKAIIPQHIGLAASETDDEFPELAKEARDKARRERLQEDLSTTLDVKNPLKEQIPALTSTPKVSNTTIPVDDPPEPTVEIFINSSIPNARPLIVQRKLGQRLKEARLAWCNYNQHLFSWGRDADVILTWRGKQTYDSTSCKGLGIGIDVEGNVVEKGVKDAFGEENRQIHMEATTREILEHSKLMKQKKADDELENDLDVPSLDHNLQDSTAPLKPNAGSRIRLILKARGFEDFKVTVKLTHPIQRLLHGFSKFHGITDDRNVYVMFDGERLEPESSIEDQGISDMDTLDVYVK